MPRRPTPRRVRRDPEDARTLILDAAERVFADRGPDAAGLKDVAAAAGVSHALVSHYFGSYDALVEQTLERRIARVREDVLADIVTATAEAPEALLARVAAIAEDRVTVRLAAWAFLSGRAQRSDFFSARTKGLAQVVDALLAKRAALGLAARPREEIEVAVVSGLTMIMGFGLAREAVLSGLGHPRTGPGANAFAARYRAHVAKLVRLGLLT